MLWKVKWNAWSGNLSRKEIAFPFCCHLKPIHHGISRWDYASTISGRWVSILFLKLVEKEASKFTLTIHSRVYQIQLKKKFPLISNLKHLLCDWNHCFSPSTCSENRNWWLLLVLIESNYFPEYLKLYTSCKLNTCAYIHTRAHTYTLTLRTLQTGIITWVNIKFWALDPVEEAI